MFSARHGPVRVPTGRSGRDARRTAEAGPSQDALDEESVEGELPHGVFFRDPRARETFNSLDTSDTSDTAPLPAEEISRLDAADWSEPILFYPNGRAANARLELQGPKGLSVDVTLRGLTGMAKVGKAPTPAAAGGAATGTARMKPNRAAFSLLEVLLATSLLLACAVVLAELANIGRAHAESADELASAQLACQTKLNEILCGATPAATVEKQPLEDMPGWLLSVEITSLEQPGLAALARDGGRGRRGPRG